MSSKTPIVVLLVFLFAVSMAPLCSGMDFYTIDTTISVGAENVESFTVDAGSTFGWEVWVYSMSGVEVTLLDAENFQRRAEDKSFTCIHGPTAIGAQGSNGSFHTAEEGGTFYLIVKATGPVSAEVSITLIDVPFFSTSFGKIALMVLRAIGVLILIIFIVVAILLLRARLIGKRNDDSFPALSARDQSDYSLDGSRELDTENKHDENLTRKASSDDYKAIDPFQDDPYIRSKSLWRRK